MISRAPCYRAMKVKRTPRCFNATGVGEGRPSASTRRFGLDVFVRAFQSLMQRRSIFIVEPVSRIERQEFDLGSFRQISGLIDHKPTGLDSALQRHPIAVNTGRRGATRCSTPVGDGAEVATRWPCIVPGKDYPSRYPAEPATQRYGAADARLTHSLRRWHRRRPDVPEALGGGDNRAPALRVSPRDLR